MYSFSQRSLERMDGVNPKLIEIAKHAIRISKIDFGIPEFGGYRTEVDQHKLFSRGVSQCDGTELKSYHQTGNALDVYAYVDGKASWKKEHLAMIAAAMLQAASALGYRLEWGGLFISFNDMPHFQLVGED